MREPAPFFSIIIPTYNRAHLIGDTINSIITQSFSDFELIVVDDGSTDNTEEVVKSFNDVRIRYFFKNHEERNIARNYGAHLASGVYVLFFDSDDYMFSDCLQMFKREIDKKNPDVIAGNILIYGKEYNVFEKFQNSSVLTKLCGPDHIFLPTTFIKKKMLDTVQFPIDEQFTRSEDKYFVMELARLFRFHFIPYVGVKVIEHPERSVYEKEISLYDYSYQKFKSMAKRFLSKKQLKILDAELTHSLAAQSLKRGMIKKSLLNLLLALKKKPSKIFEKRYLYLWKLILEKAFKRNA